MESKKDLIIRLIQQDMKHNQLTGGLQKIGLNVDLHHLEIIEVVIKLMELSTGDASDQWAKTYFSFLEQAAEYEVANNAENLLPLAEECFNLLLACQHIEQRVSEQ